MAKNCNASIDVKKGAEAKNWRGGRAVRVIRNVKGRKHSKYAPEEGNRYDGIYKVGAVITSHSPCFGSRFQKALVQKFFAENSRRQRLFSTGLGVGLKIVL